MIRRDLKVVFIVIVMAFLAVTLSACFNKSSLPASEKALVELKGRLDTSVNSNRGWVIARGLVINRGSRRADWLQVTVYTKDKRTGIVLQKKSTYVNGSGPSKKSLNPGESGSFKLRLDSKPSYRHFFEAEVSWSDVL